MLGVGAGVLSGVIQGLIMTRLNLSSVGVTLGGLLTLQGITYVLTENKDHRLRQHRRRAWTQCADRPSSVGAQRRHAGRCLCSPPW